MRTGRQLSARERAVARWGECSVSSVDTTMSDLCVRLRHKMRDRKVVGALPRMDRYAAKDRGRGYARFLAEFSAYVLDASEGRITPLELAQELGAMSADIVMTVAKERPGAA